MLTGLLAVLMVGHVAGSVEGGSSGAYPRYDHRYYGESGGYGGYPVYNGCSAYRGSPDCGRYGGGYGYREYSYRRYEYGYRGYDYGGYGGYGE
jgi:hypothetical protein